MSKEEKRQLELFQLDSPHADVPGSFSRSRDPEYSKKINCYQKGVAYLITGIFISIISFSVGVERGKKIVLKVSASYDLPVVQDNRSSQQPAKVLTVTEPSKSAAGEGLRDAGKSTPAVEPLKFSYTIQVASIGKSKNADKTLTGLQKSGYSAFSIIKGQYIVLCVGKFNNRTKAADYSKKLKSSYPDCIVRRL